MPSCVVKVEAVVGLLAAQMVAVGMRWKMHALEHNSGMATVEMQTIKNAYNVVYQLALKSR